MIGPRFPLGSPPYVRRWCPVHEVSSLTEKECWMPGCEVPTITNQEFLRLESKKQQEIFGAVRQHGGERGIGGR